MRLTLGNILTKFQTKYADSSPTFLNIENMESIKTDEGLNIVQDKMQNFNLVKDFIDIVTSVKYTDKKFTSKPWVALAGGNNNQTQKM